VTLPGEGALQPPTVMPQFAPFVVAPLLLRSPTTLMIAVRPELAPVDLVLVQAPAPMAEVLPVAPAAPIVPLVAPVAMPQPPLVPLVAPLRRPAKPYRN
jgi:hypothetical protein